MNDLQQRRQVTDQEVDAWVSSLVAELFAYAPPSDLLERIRSAELRPYIKRELQLSRVCQAMPMHELAKLELGSVRQDAMAYVVKARPLPPLGQLTFADFFSQ